jgi:GGDEF domain-containing protein
VLADLRRPVSYLTLSGLRVGGSVGGAIWRPGSAPLTDAMRSADEALRAAKRAGRDQFRQALPHRVDSAPDSPSGETLRA